MKNLCKIYKSYIKVGFVLGRALSEKIIKNIPKVFGRFEA